MTDGPSVVRPREGLLALAGLYVLAVLVYAVLGHREAVPLVAPDEFIYGHLARSLADGQGFTWRGDGVSLHAALYVYAITPAWLLASLTKAYSIAKLEGAMLIGLAVVPTWLIARPALGPRLALVPAALAVAGTWMTTTAGLLTENLAYPLSAAALAAMVAVLGRPGSRWGWIALGLSLLAAWARLQCVALLPILALALVVRAAAARPGARARLAPDRALLAVSAGLSLAGGILVLADPAILGSYAGIGEFRPSISRLLSAIGHQSIGLVTMAGLLPIVVAVAAASRARAWRDERLAPLLAVTTAAAAVLIGQSAWTVTGFGSWHIQRYVEYVLPVLFVTAAVAVHGGVVTRGRLVGATLALAAALLLSPPVRQVLEERATFGLSLRADDLLGVSTPVALTLATLVTGALAAVLLFRSGALARPGAALLIVAAITGAVLLVQDQAGWSWQIRLSQAFRAGYPHDLSWLDHSGPAPVARLLVTGSSPRWPVTEVFNRDVTAVYAPEGVPTSAVRGRSCQWTAQDSGALQFSGPCGTPPQRFYVDDDFGHMSFYGQHVDAGDPVVGEVVTVRGAPRLQSIVNVPCSRPTPHVDFGRRGRITAPLRICAASLDGHVWLDRPGVVLVRFRGDADTTHLATVGTQQYEIPPNTVTTIRIPEPAGSSGFTVTLDWSTPAPGLAAVDLLQAGHSTSLL